MTKYSRYSERAKTGRITSYQIFLLLLLAMFGLPLNSAGQNAATTLAPVSAEEYKIYSAFINGMMNQRTKLIVIEDKVNGGGGAPVERILFGERFEHLKKQAGFSELEAETIDNYLAQPEASQPLDRLFQLPVNYTLVDAESYKEFFKNGPRDGWETFYEKYPDSPGVITLSKVAFNRKKTQALFFAAVACGSRCFEGGFRFYIKEKGQWVFHGQDNYLHS